ncbi:MAG TPA: hypothetical protein VFU57_12200 [Candidatus Acidoferrales bacterium]|nr:hypothetical protein [Candidatus Acidoferrales bacterium]
MKTRIVKASLSITLAAALFIAGCSTSWIKIALADLPIITQVALNIASIVAAAQSKGQAGAAANTQIQFVANQVQSDLTLVENLINTYQSTSAASRAGIVGQISTALADAQSNLKSILTAVHVDNVALQSTITAAVAIAISTLTSIQSLIPQPAPAPAPASAKSARASVPPPSAKELRAEFNRIFNSNGFPQAQLK